ncbi:MAG TPA: hypothetical protein VJQ52_11165 [Steroidobacteraceae bacterium]|nr:hypothetical protein [Steroidobacteraceae bacterium]
MRKGKAQALSAIPLALALVGAAQGAQSSLDALFACQKISGDAARLACLDREVAALRGESKPAAPIAAARAIAPDREKERVEQDSYGRERPSAPLATAVRDKDGRIEGLENLAVAGVSETPHRKLVVKLQNGQVWTQIDSIRMFAPRSTPGAKTTASIRNAALGSYKMQLNGDGPWFRVIREK